MTRSIQSRNSPSTNALPPAIVPAPASSIAAHVSSIRRCRSAASAAFQYLAIHDPVEATMFQRRLPPAWTIVTGFRFGKNWMIETIPSMLCWNQRYEAFLNPPANSAAMVAMSAGGGGGTESSIDTSKTRVLSVVPSLTRILSFGTSTSAPPSPVVEPAGSYVASTRVPRPCAVRTGAPKEIRSFGPSSPWIPGTHTGGDGSSAS
ncbi:MAG: hypothetical protein M5U31_09770 [Acidimicrobiia bacterium]|nr:hypothetical protein [Acidimicrobiia bacterium]